MTKKDDDLNVFQNSLNGNREHWVEGRKTDYGTEGGEWLNRYQGKNFERTPSRLKKWIKGVLYGKHRND